MFNNEIQENKLIEKKIDFLKLKYGQDLIFKYCSFFWIENTSSDELIISDFFRYGIVKILINEKLINKKIQLLIVQNY